MYFIDKGKENSLYKEWIAIGKSSQEVKNWIDLGVPPSFVKYNNGYIYHWQYSTNYKKIYNILKKYYGIVE